MTTVYILRHQKLGRIASGRYATRAAAETQLEKEKAAGAAPDWEVSTIDLDLRPIREQLKQLANSRAGESGGCSDE